MSGNISSTVGKSSVTNGSVPNNALTYSFSITLVANTIQTVDLRQQQTINNLKDIQGIFIDNSANSSVLTCIVGTGQNLVIPPNGQLMAPCYVAPGTPVFTFAGAGVVNVVLNNFPTPAACWIGANETIPTSGGKVLVSDVLLDNQIINGAFSASTALYGNADSIVHERAGSNFSGVITNSGTVTPISGAPSVFLTDVLVTIDPNAIATVASEIEIILAFQNAGTIATAFVQVPTIAATGLAGPITILRLDDINLIGALAGDNLGLVTSGGSLSAGALRWTIIGGTTGTS